MPELNEGEGYKNRMENHQRGRKKEEGTTIGGRKREKEGENEEVVVRDGKNKTMSLQGS